MCEDCRRTDHRKLANGEGYEEWRQRMKVTMDKAWDELRSENPHIPNIELLKTIFMAGYVCGAADTRNEKERIINEAAQKAVDEIVGELRRRH